MEIKLNQLCSGIMSKRMKKYRNELCFLSTCSKSQRANFIEQAPPDVIGAISDISNTLLHGNLPLTNSQRQRLRKDFKLLKALAGKQNSLVKKRKLILSQKGGSILGVIWNVIKNLF